MYHHDILQLKYFPHKNLNIAAFKCKVLLGNEPLTNVTFNETNYGSKSDFKLAHPFNHHVYNTSLSS